MNAFLKKTYFGYQIQSFFPDTLVAGFTDTRIEGIETQVPFDMKNRVYPSLSQEIAWMKQVHSAHVHWIKTPGQYEADGLYTHEHGISLVVRTADCLPLLIYNQRDDSIGVIHMGWRGAHAGILATLDKDLSSCKVVLGVGLRQCCYAVGEEFLQYPHFRPFLLLRKGHWHFDPIGFVCAFLYSRGIPNTHILDVNMCSQCHSDQFFSFRKTKDVQRTLSFILRIKDPVFRGCFS